MAISSAMAVCLSAPHVLQSTKPNVVTMPTLTPAARPQNVKMDPMPAAQMLLDKSCNISELVQIAIYKSYSHISEMKITILPSSRVFAFAAQDKRRVRMGTREVSIAITKAPSLWLARRGGMVTHHN